MNLGQISDAELTKIVKFSTQNAYLDPNVYCFCQGFHPVSLFVAVPILGTLEYVKSTCHHCLSNILGNL